MFATTSFPPIDCPNLIARINHTKAFVLVIMMDIKMCLNPKGNCFYLSRNSKLSTVPANSITQDRYTVLVVRIAQIVPIGILF
jgi:hypothetical protein